MDGLLIDSEPLWNEAANRVFARYNIHLTPQQYESTTGLRTKEFVHWWFAHYGQSAADIDRARQSIVEEVITLVEQKGVSMPGVHYIFDFFHTRGFRIGMATSSPKELIDVVLNMLDIRNYLGAVSSADQLAYGKPHPQVYLDCATVLGASPMQCICFEDSYNGLIAAKAARMKCVVVPSPEKISDPRWNAADLKISSLADFTDDLLKATGRF